MSEEYWEKGKGLAMWNWAIYCFGSTIFSISCSYTHTFALDYIYDFFLSILAEIYFIGVPCDWWKICCLQYKLSLSFTSFIFSIINCNFFLCWRQILVLFHSSSFCNIERKKSTLHVWHIVNCQILFSSLFYSSFSTASWEKFHLNHNTGWVHVSHHFQKKKKTLTIKSSFSSLKYERKREKVRVRSQINSLLSLGKKKRVFSSLVSPLYHDEKRGYWYQYPLDVKTILEFIQTRKNSLDSCSSLLVIVVSHAVMARDIENFFSLS